MANPALGTGELAAIIGGLLAEDLDFPRLAKLEEGVDKVQRARRTLQKLKDCLGDTPVPTPSSSDQFADRRQEAAVRRHRAEMLRGLNERFLAMFASTDPHGRGKAFEELLRDLFEYFDLSPRGSFRPEAEEIDGSIVHEGTHILVEAKWHSAPVEASSIAIFRAKVDDKLKTTIGLYISMSGYTQGAIDKAGSAGARSMILVEGSELMPVLEGRVDFGDLLARKIRRAHETGCALFKPFN